MIAYAFNPSTLATEAGRFLCVPHHPGLSSNFQASQGCIMKPYLMGSGREDTKHIWSLNIHGWFIQTHTHTHTLQVFKRKRIARPTQKVGRQRRKSVVPCCGHVLDPARCLSHEVISIVNSHKRPFTYSYEHPEEMGCSLHCGSALPLTRFKVIIHPYWNRIQGALCILVMG